MIEVVIFCRVKILFLLDFLLFFGIAIFFFLLSKNEGTKGITSEYFTKDGVKRTAKKEREDYIV